ncbi:MAG TPA: hypothetical protein ACFYD5_02175 [Candidatus Tripitaka sp. YC43]
MSAKGQTGTVASINLKTSVELRPTEFSLSPRGKIVVSLPGLKIRLSEISIGLLFLPLLRLGGFEITTEPAEMEVDLSDTTIQTRLERAGQLQVITTGEIRANATLEGTGEVNTGPFKLEV